MLPKGKISLLLLVLSAGGFAAPAEKLDRKPQLRPHILTAASQNGNDLLPPELRKRAGQWLNQHFDWMAGGTFDVPLTGAVYAQYQDSAGLYSTSVYSLIKDAASEAGFNYEDMLLHARRDYTVGAGLAFVGMDQFDHFDNTNWKGGDTTSAHAANGAFIQSGLNWSDVTTELYAGGSVSVKDKLYLGYAEPYDLVSFVLAKPFSGQATWEYWDGANWKPLNLDQNASDLRASGHIQFSPPLDWTPRSFRESFPKYWTRLSVKDGPVTFAKVHGDDWKSHVGSNTNRGWDPTACQSSLVKMKNGIEYCSRPGSMASARFRYQSRVCGMWANNYMFGNPSDYQKSQLTWTASIVRSMRLLNGGVRYNGVMFDNASGMPQWSSPAFSSANAASLTDLKTDVPGGGRTWYANVENVFRSAKERLHEKEGPAYSVGGNDGGGDPVLTTILEWNLIELGFTTWRTGDAPLNPPDPGMDTYKPPRTQRVAFAVWDNQHFGLLYLDGRGKKTPHLWDTAERTPMAGLATYYIGMNPNTAFLYNTVGWRYFDTDEFYYWAAETATLASLVNSDPSPSYKSLALSGDGKIAVPGGPLWRNTTIAASAAQAENVYGYALRIGGKDVVRAFKDSSGHWHTFTPIMNAYPSGTTVEFAKVGHHSSEKNPPVDRIWYWSNWIPAEDADIGVPDPKGWKGGLRDTKFLTGSAASTQPTCSSVATCAEVWRRDFTNAIILDRVMRESDVAEELDLYGPPIDLQKLEPRCAPGCKYYRLHADGTTSPAITQVKLRAAEASVLMKAPVTTGK